MSAPIIPDEFMQWFRKNYPGPDTIIHKPDWHATRVYQAAIHASRSGLCAPTQDERVKALAEALVEAVKAMPQDWYDDNCDCKPCEALHAALRAPEQG